MEVISRWMFTKEQIARTPSRKYNIDAETELQIRQHAAMFIQDVAQGLRISQICVYTAIVYMHRFYMYHSFTHFCKYKIGIATLFLASKTEDMPLRMEHILKQAHRFLYKGFLESKSEQYVKMADDLLFNENVLLMTLGFELTIKHPHTYVVSGCSMIKANKELTSACYLMASKSLHLTTMCLQYCPRAIACFCIHLAAKWANFPIQISKDGSPWYKFICEKMTEELLIELTEEFLRIYERCPLKLKQAVRKGQIKTESTQKQQGAVSHHNGNHSHQKQDCHIGHNSKHNHHNQHEQHRHHSHPGHFSQYHKPGISVTQSVLRPENDQKPVQPKIVFPTPPLSQKSILSPEEIYPTISPKEPQPNKPQPKISPLFHASVASPAMTIPNAGPPSSQKNLLKRRSSIDAHSSQKRPCTSAYFEKSAKITEEISSILKTAVISPELSKPSPSLPSANFSSMTDTKEEAKSFVPLFSERSLTHQPSMDLPFNIFDNEIENLFQPVANLPTSSFSVISNKYPITSSDDNLRNQGFSTPQAFSEKKQKGENFFSSEQMFTLQTTSSIQLEDSINSLDVNLRNQVFSIPQAFPEMKQENTLSNDQFGIKGEHVRIESEDDSQSIKVESSPVELEAEVESFRSTVDFSQILSIPLEETNHTVKEHKKSKKLKKEKKHKKDKERKTEKRKNKTKDKKIMNELQAPLAPIKISIPKEKLNLSQDFALDSGGKHESPQNGSLKLRISKKRLSSSDTESAVQNVQTSLKLKILVDPRGTDKTWMALPVQSITNGY